MLPLVVVGLLVLLGLQMWAIEMADLNDLKPAVIDDKTNTTDEPAEVITTPEDDPESTLPVEDAKTEEGED